MPEKHVDVVDNDLMGEVLEGDIKEVEDALNYEGEDGAYEELEDNFFAKMIGDCSEPSGEEFNEMKGEANRGFTKPDKKQ
jgi:hypothetical protein